MRFQYGCLHVGKINNQQFLNKYQRKMAETNVSYKTLHEQFVSNNEGTTIVETSIVLSSVATFVLLRNVACRSMPNSDNLLFRIIIDYMFLILPLQLELTVMSEYIDSIFIFIVFTILTLFVTRSLTQGHNSQEFRWNDFLNQTVDNRLPFIVNSRAYTLVVTAISILAVDFTVYPRRFGKVETYGTGLMDCGVGIIIVSNAVVAPEARGKLDVGLTRSIKSCIPLVILGTLRVLSVKGADYQEHVTEYGVHWNFFFTLAVVKILSTILYKCIPSMFWTLTSIAFISTYQHCLTTHGLGAYIVNGIDGKGGRQGLIDSNREGIFSSIGYFSLYLFGVRIGMFIFNKKRHTVYDWVKVQMTFMTAAAVSFILLNLSITYIQPVSRRFANLTFVIWMVGLGTLLLGVMLLSQIADELYRYIQTLSNKNHQTEKDKVDSGRRICLLESVNYNGLLYFLLANLLTGLVNLSLKTIFVPPLKSFIIITMYMFSLTTLSMFLYSRKIKLKFW